LIFLRKIYKVRIQLGATPGRFSTFSGRTAIATWAMTLSSDFCRRFAGSAPLSPLLLQMVLAYHILVSIVIEGIPRESKKQDTLCP